MQCAQCNEVRKPQRYPDWGSMSPGTLTSIMHYQVVMMLVLAAYHFLSHSFRGSRTILNQKVVSQEVRLPLSCQRSDSADTSSIGISFMFECCLHIIPINSLFVHSM